MIDEKTYGQTTLSMVNQAHVRFIANAILHVIVRASDVLLELAESYDLPIQESALHLGNIANVMEPRC